MPETPVNENDLSWSRENHVGSSGEVACVKPVSEAHAVNQTAYNHLWAGVHSLYAGHPLTSLLFGEIIHWVGRS
jgi:hypothetical protein